MEGGFVFNSGIRQNDKTLDPLPEETPWIPSNMEVGIEDTSNFIEERRSSSQNLIQEVPSDVEKAVDETLQLMAGEIHRRVARARRNRPLTSNNSAEGRANSTSTPSSPAPASPADSSQRQTAAPPKQTTPFDPVLLEWPQIAELSESALRLLTSRLNANLLRRQTQTTQEEGRKLQSERDMLGASREMLRMESRRSSAERDRLLGEAQKLEIERDMLSSQLLGRRRRSIEDDSDATSSTGIFLEKLGASSSNLLSRHSRSIYENRKDQMLHPDPEKTNSLIGRPYFLLGGKPYITGVGFHLSRSPIAIPSDPEDLTKPNPTGTVTYLPIYHPFGSFPSAPLPNWALGDHPSLRALMFSHSVPREVSVGIPRGRASSLLRSRPAAAGSLLRSQSLESPAPGVVAAEKDSGAHVAAIPQAPGKAPASPAEEVAAAVAEAVGAAQEAMAEAEGGSATAPSSPAQPFSPVLRHSVLSEEEEEGRKRASRNIGDEPELAVRGRRLPRWV